MTTATNVIKEVTFTRTLNAPRELVFRAWTDEKMLAQWWGPRGFTAPRCEFDARKGGAIRIDMTMDKTVYPLSGTVLEIDPPRKLVFFGDALGKSDEVVLHNLNTITFEEKNGKTEVTVVAQVLEAGPGMEGALSGMDAGWSQTLDKLGEFIETVKK